MRFSTWPGAYAAARGRIPPFVSDAHSRWDLVTNNGKSKRTTLCGPRSANLSFMSNWTSGGHPRWDLDTIMGRHNRCSCCRDAAQVHGTRRATLIALISSYHPLQPTQMEQTGDSPSARQRPSGETPLLDTLLELQKFSNQVDGDAQGALILECAGKLIATFLERCTWDSANLRATFASTPSWSTALRPRRP